MEGVKLSDVTADQIREYASRDWALKARSKEDHWIAQRSTMTHGEALAMADGLRQFSRRLRPDWPSEADRAEDFAAHDRLARLLDLAAKRTSPLNLSPPPRRSSTSGVPAGTFLARKLS